MSDMSDYPEYLLEADGRRFEDAERTMIGLVINDSEFVMTAADAKTLAGDLTVLAGDAGDDGDDSDDDAE